MTNAQNGKEIVTLYHGTALKNLDSILTHGIQKPCSLGNVQNWGGPGSKVKAANSIYVTKHFLDALIWGGNSGDTKPNLEMKRKTFQLPGGRTWAHLHIDKYGATQDVVVFEVNVPEILLNVESDRLARTGPGEMYHGMSSAEILKHVYTYEVSQQVLRPSRYAIVKANSNLYTTKNFRMALKFWDVEVRAADLIPGGTYAEFLQSDKKFVDERVDWEKCSSR